MGVQLSTGFAASTLVVNLYTVCCSCKAVSSRKHTAVGYSAT